MTVLSPSCNSAVQTLTQTQTEPEAYRKHGPSTPLGKADATKDITFATPSQKNLRFFCLLEQYDVIGRRNNEVICGEKSWQRFAVLCIEFICLGLTATKNEGKYVYNPEGRLIRMKR